jgi:large subunit ribosomal protein L16
MLMPKRTKYRKQQKGRLRGLAYKGSDVSFGDYGLQALESGRVTARQIEAARMAIQRATKRAGRLYIRVFPDTPVTKKPLETRMGSGKGGVELWVCKVLAGRMMYELSGLPKDVAKEALTTAQSKLPIKTRFMDRSEQP